MNLIFSNAQKNIIFLLNENNFGDDYIINLINQLNNFNTNFVSLRFLNDKNNIDIYNQ